MTAASAFALSLAGLARQSVSLRSTAGINDYGESTYAGSTTAVSAYVQRLSVSDATLDADDVVIDYMVYIPSTSVTVAMTDELTLPSGEIRPIIRVDYRYDEHGQQAVVLAVGKV